MNQFIASRQSPGGCCEAIYKLVSMKCLYLADVWRVFRSWLAIGFAGLRQTMAGRWRAHGKALQVGNLGINRNRLLDCLIARLLDAG